MQISAVVRFPPSGAARAFARVRVTVRDVSELDGPARTVAQADLTSVQVPPTGLDLPVSLTADLPDPARTYLLRAHADVDGTGSVAAGDLVTTTAHVVRAGEPMVLALEPVSG